MNTSNHPQAIITNARQGRAVSTRNRPRAGRVNVPVTLIGLGLLAFWVIVGLAAMLAA